MHERQNELITGVGGRSVIGTLSWHGALSTTRCPNLQLSGSSADPPRHQKTENSGSGSPPARPPHPSIPHLLARPWRPPPRRIGPQPEEQQCLWGLAGDHATQLTCITLVPTSLTLGARSGVSIATPTSSGMVGLFGSLCRKVCPSGRVASQQPWILSLLCATFSSLGMVALSLAFRSLDNFWGRTSTGPSTECSIESSRASML